MKSSIPLIYRRLGTLAWLWLASISCHAENLLANGGFNHKDGPLTGWITDYAFSENSYYVDNKDRISVVNGKAVLKSNGDAGVKLECRPMTIEPGFKYTAALDVKGSARIYFAGYKWKPGIRPHANPEIGELRMIYKSKAAEGAAGTKPVTLELPGVKLTPQAKTALKEVRFITLLIVMMTDGTVANVSITKAPDPEMKL